ncbi:MAG TPA: YolD-like family protein [Pseudogracilibacillus sp.]|nr:YolD-like family protein [Pseudogracilibacillus sp.]
MQVQDRGTMKWVSLMLPEHVELLKEVFVERQDKPTLDEQKMTEIDQTVKYAIKHHTPLEMTYFYNGRFEKIVSRLEKIDQWRGFILLKNEAGIKISLSSLIDVRLV